MNIQEHVIYAIEAYERKEIDHALMHACMTIDATSRKLYSKQEASNIEYKNCLREYYWLIERFLAGGINLKETKFTNLSLKNGKGKDIPEPDFADVIYHIFRCYSAHCREIPISYKLLPFSDGLTLWKFGTKGVLQLSERAIFALLAVAVFSKANDDLSSTGDYYLSWGSKQLALGVHEFLIKDYWGKEDAIKSFFSENPQISVNLEGLDKFK